MIIYLDITDADRIQSWKLNVVNRLSELKVLSSIEFVSTSKKNLQRPLSKIQKWIENKIFPESDLICAPSFPNCVATDEDGILNLSSLQLEEIESISKELPIYELQYNGVNLTKLNGIGVEANVQNGPSVEVSLIKITPNSRMVCYTAYLYRHISAHRNWINATNDAANIIVKGLFANEPLVWQTTVDSSKISSYLCLFYSNVVNKIWSKIKSKLVKSHFEHWTLALGEGKFMSGDSKKLYLQKVPDSEFWADPFIVDEREKTYIFFERYPFSTCKGVISVGEVCNNKVINVRDVLVRPYHLSFPHIIKRDGGIFMIPESSENKTLEVWRAVDFPDKWELYSSSFKGESVADSVFFTDSQGNNYLFTSVSNKSQDEHCYKLSLYNVDSLKMQEVHEHPMSPISLDCSSARNGGCIFGYDGKLYRVAQDTRFGNYGTGIRIMEIMDLTPSSYREREVQIIDSPLLPDTFGLHHMTQAAKMYVLDIKTSRS